jgi:hypothetical protein
MSDFNKRQVIEYAFVAIVVLGTIVFLISVPPERSKVYNCSISEISPDYPIEVKEQCRQLRAKNFQEDLRKPK